ncbi:hypothetical protein [Aeromonas rivipollensis]
MSFVIETAAGASAVAIADLIKEWSALRDAKKGKVRISGEILLG